MDCDECPNDPGGYVIINGNEKVIISQEKIANNSIQVYPNQKQNKKYSLSQRLDRRQKICSVFLN